MQEVEKVGVASPSECGSVAVVLCQVLRHRLLFTQDRVCFGTENCKFDFCGAHSLTTLDSPISVSSDLYRPITALVFRDSPTPVRGAALSVYALYRLSVSLVSLPTIPHKRAACTPYPVYKYNKVNAFHIIRLLKTRVREPAQPVSHIT